MSTPLVMDEAELPEVLREALKAARERMADKRARRARGEAGDDEDEDDDEEFEVGLTAVQVTRAAPSALPPCARVHCSCYTSCLLLYRKVLAFLSRALWQSPVP